jgi:single-strand DNA-binding protein
MRDTLNGQAANSFSIATNRQYTASDGQQVKETIWFRISAWGRQAETCNQFLHRGSRMLVEGRLNVDPATGAPRIWTRQGGSPGVSFEVTAATVRFLSSKAEEGPFAPDESAAEEEIPF